MKSPPPYRVEMTGEASGLCDCCGRASQSVWGLLYAEDAAVAAYWVHWTPDHLGETGANLDLVIGSWGAGTTAEDRCAVSLLHRLQADGSPAVMVIDAGERTTPAKTALAAIAMRRDEVVGTPLAAQVFDLVDAINEQDERLF